MRSAILADPTRALQRINRGSGLTVEESENDVGSLETVWGELYRPPGCLPTRTRLSSVPKTNRDSSLNTTFCQSVTFHIDLAWHYCRRSCQCSGVKVSARKGCLDLRFVSARCLEIVCGTIATPTSADIIGRVTVGSTSACRTILRSSLLVVFLVVPDPVFGAWVPSRVHCSQQFLTAHSERSTWLATRRVDHPSVFIPMIRPLSNSLNCEKCLPVRLPGMFRLPNSSYNRRVAVEAITSILAEIPVDYQELSDFQREMLTSPHSRSLPWSNGQSRTLKLRSAGKRMEDSERWRAVGRIEAGQSITDVALFFGVHHSVISRLWKQFQTTQTVFRRPVGGPPRVTTPEEDRYIAIVAQRNCKETSTRVSTMVTASISKAISAATVRRRLHINGLYARVPRVCVPLSVQSRGARLKWCREHSNWTVTRAMPCLLMSQDLLWSQMTSV
ncbi:uncharacterized protein TNCV_1703201 [Trichonephila clavipes]|nr:uncharacterized protein TNCV_1703201 [Trichonephila clavipes]